MAKTSAGAAVAAAAVNNSFMQPMRVRPAGYGGGTSERLHIPGAVPCRKACKCARMSHESSSSVRCVLMQCVSFACALRVQRQRNIDMLCQQTCHRPGRCVAAALPVAVCVGQHLPLRDQVRSPALQLMRPHASACSAVCAPPHTTAALPMVHHLLTVVVGCVFWQVLWSVATLAAAVAAALHGRSACARWCVCGRCL